MKKKEAMAAVKRGLSNALLGRKVGPRYWESGEGSKVPMQGSWPEGFKANLSGEYLGEIVAAWTAGGMVKVALIDPYGTTGETLFVNVTVLEK